jgi:phospholipid/cholesterol/gamma-HCH transport system substrate-binding protein
METRANYVLIGAFVLLAAAALMLFTLWIAGTPLNRSYSTYDVVFEGPVNGLTEGGEVRFNGIKVGEVTRLSLDRTDPNRVIARIRVDSQTPVRTDSIAQLDFLGITGVTFIQIRAGKASSPLLESDDFGTPPVIATERTALDELLSGGQSILSVTSETLNNINRALSDENVDRIGAILANVEKASAKIADDGGVIDSANSALKSVDKAAAQLASAASAIDELARNDVATLARDGAKAIAELGPAVENVREAAENINGTVMQINKELTPSTGRALDQIANAAGDLQAMMVRIQGLLNEIDQDPSRFLYRQPQPVE